MHTMEELEAAAKTAGTTHDVLQTAVRELEDEITALKRRRMTRIRNALGTAIEARAALLAAVEDSPELFKRPKSRAIHGVRFGFEKGKGKITWTDPDGVVRLIERHFPDSAALLIKTTKKPVRAALAKLPTQDLKRIGCQVGDTDNAPFIRMVDTELEKFVNALLEDDELNRSAA